MDAGYWSHLEQIRRAEGELALGWMRKTRSPPARLIEIGGGSGWQAQEFAKAGYDVASYDVASTEYTEARTFPVRDYDGHRLPEPDGSADIVFSSNVLEHIPHVLAFQAELLRVLKPDGCALHILPTAYWRLWTTATHYPDVARKIAAKLAGRTRAKETAGAKEHVAATTAPKPVRPDMPTPSLSRVIANNLLPPRHGEIGSAFSELYYFSRWRWSRLFEATGWRIEAYATNRLAYTGHALVGSRVGLPARARLSRALGSACHVFLLRKA